MTKLRAFLICALLAAGALASFAAPPPPPPVQDYLTVTAQADREFLDEHADTLAKLTRLAARKRSYAAQVAADTAAIVSLGAKIRRGIVRHKPAADGLLPAALADVAVDLDTPGETTLHWNDAAETYRNP